MTENCDDFGADLEFMFDFHSSALHFHSYTGPDYCVEHTITETDGRGAKKYF
jgi:hypothetical protein